MRHSKLQNEKLDDYRSVTIIPGKKGNIKKYLPKVFGTDTDNAQNMENPPSLNSKNKKP